MENSPCTPSRSPQHSTSVSLEVVSTAELQRWMTTIETYLNEVCSISTEGKLNSDQKLKISNLCRKVGKGTSEMAVLYQSLKQQALDLSSKNEALKEKCDLTEHILALKQTVQESSTVGNVSFADMVKKGANSFVRPANLSSVAVYPKDKQKSSEETKNLVQKIICPEQMKLKVRGLQKTKNGGVLISTETKNDAEKLKQAVQQSTFGLTADEPQKRKPRIKLSEPKRNLILDAKRSNTINIAMKKLPTPQTIKAAIMKMDATVIGREGIEKLLTMLPTEEEKVKIQEAQYANPDLPLGSAEQFLLTLASINELSSRLKLWVFKLDFDNLEKEIAEPLMDLKQGIELLKVNRTFKVILSTLRTVGNYLNGNYAKGFRLEYLSKVVEVKDCPQTPTPIGPVIRASKVDFDVLTANLQKLESDCKASWDHMKRVAKHDGSQIFKTKINEFLTDAAERIILLSLIRKRVMSRFNKFLLFLGVPPCDISKTKPAEFLKVIAEFSLEYRTTRERVLQQLEKKANHRERNKTRGKMIIDVSNYSTKNGDHTAGNALKELLKTVPDTDSLTDGRRKNQSNNRRILVNGDFSADDEILESLVRSATTKRMPMARERRRNRISDR
ncbi:FH1/FH2 domain-containing protein 3-like [Anticarsia gemmatalis]|uniref:FH1/FH2 domain-containing protein 3-like n=1 Tax=Anticarsia gemmatalis TaxID=129554 RepID=UPI003F770A1D